MKIAGIDKTSFVDYPSLIAATVFTAGCNLDCWYCHNRHIIGGEVETVDEEKVFDFLASRRGMLDGVVISGGEPTLQKDLGAFMERVKSLGFKVKLDTNGTAFEKTKLLVDSGLIDFIAMDYKAPIDDYANVCGANEFKDSIVRLREYLKRNVVDYEFRTTVVPSFTKEDIVKMANELKGAKTWYLQAYRRPEFLSEDFPRSVSKDKMRELLACGRELFPNLSSRGINLD